MGHTYRSKEFKLSIVKAALEPKRRPRNSLSKYTSHKELSEVEQLRYELAKAELELSKLKKAYTKERRWNQHKK